MRDFFRTLRDRETLTVDTLKNRQAFAIGVDEIAFLSGALALVVSEDQPDVPFDAPRRPEPLASFQ